LNQCGIGVLGAQALGHAVAHNGQHRGELRELRLCENPFGTEGARALGEGLAVLTGQAGLSRGAARGLQQLVLRSCQLGDDGAAAVAQMMRANRSITKVCPKKWIRPMQVLFSDIRCSCFIFSLC
jgi:hypothetical protein